MLEDSEKHLKWCIQFYSVVIPIAIRTQFLYLLRTSIYYAAVVLSALRSMQLDIIYVGLKDYYYI
jgi:hypothetical protein